jgi:hypothetical protein
MNRNRSLLFTLAVVPASLVFGTGCKKVPPVPEAGVMDAAVDMDAGAADAAVDPTAMLDATAPLTTATATHTAVATGGPFQGSYKCFGNMSVSQNGNAVTARLFPGDSKTYSILVCSVSGGNDCEGKVTSYTNGKAGEVRTASLKRNDKGDLTYRGQNETQPTLCRKN